jgi:hypothetical protein
MAGRRGASVDVPVVVRDEIEAAARRAQRSVAFIVARALAAGRADAKNAHAPARNAHGQTAKNSHPVDKKRTPPDEKNAHSNGELVALTLTLDEDDAPETAARLRAASGATVAAAWLETRARFAAWIARIESADAAERADDLDAALRDAAAPSTPAARLAELAGSDYPRVRALVAAHPSTAAATLALLACDRERTVRAAALARAR